MISNDWACCRRAALNLHAARDHTEHIHRYVIAQLERQLCALGLLHFLNERGDDVEQVAYHGNVCDLEDRRFGILVDSDNTTRSFHAYYVLNRATDSEGQIQLRGNRLTGRSYLTIHGQPSRIANGPRCRNLPAQRSSELLRQLDVLLFLNAPANRNDDLRLRQIDGLLGFLERCFGLVANDTVCDGHVNRLDRGRGAALFHFVAAVRARLKRGEVRSVARERHVRYELSLEHRPSEQQLATLVLVTNRIADQRAIQCCGQLGRKVAHLVGVRHQDQPGLFLLQEAL